MAINIKSSSVSPTASGGTTITLPSGIVTGDLIVIVGGSHQGALFAPGGWTQISNISITSTYSEHLTSWYRISNGTESGTVITFTGGDTTFRGIVALVITGHEAAAPIHATSTNSTAGTKTLSTGSLSPTPTDTYKRISIWSEMANNNVIPTYTLNTSGLTLIQSATPPQGNGYHRTSVYFDDATSSGTVAAHTATSSEFGAFCSMAIAIAEGNQAPTISNVTHAPLMSGSTYTGTRFSFNYSDPEGDAVGTRDIAYRVVGTAPWSSTSATGAVNYIDVPAASLTAGEEYEFQLRVSDINVGNWSNMVTGYFTAAQYPWQYGSETTTAAQSADISGLTAGSYVVQVRTADAVGFGPWSASDSFIVLPPTNIKVRVGGSFVSGINMVKVGGIWKQAPPTLDKSGGSF